MKLNRRNFLELAAATTAVSAIGTGAAQAQSDGIIRVALSASNPRRADPNEMTQNADNWTSEQVYEHLVRPADGRFALRPEDWQPALATEWTVSDDARVWTFKLREGVQFHRGYGEMTSEDVVFSFERAREKGTIRAILANIDTVVATGPYEVVITLKAPDVNFLGTSVFMPNTMVVSKRAYEEIGAEAMLTDAVGTGAFELVEFNPEKSTHMTRFDGYWGEPAKVAGVECVYMADTTARTLALLSGDVDMIEAVRAPGWIDSILQRDSTMIVDMTTPGSFKTLHVNLTQAPWDNILVRRALVHAMDRTAIAAALAPMGIPLAGLQPSFFPGGFELDDLPEELQYRYDPDKARALLAEAGYPNGIDFDTFVTQREDYASIMLIMQEQLRLAGFNMNLNIIDHTTYHADNRSDKNTLALHSSSFPPIPTQIYFQQLSAASEVKADGSGGGNYSHYGVAIPGIDDLLAKAVAATNYDEYVELCNQIELQVLRDLPLIGVINLGFTFVRNARIDLGYPLESGYARWRLARATKSA